MSRAAAAVPMHTPASFQTSFARAQIRCPCSCPLRCVVYRIVYNPQAADGLTPPPFSVVWSGHVWSGLVPKNVDYPYLAKFHPSYPFRLALIHSNPKTAKMPPKMLITHISQNSIRPTPLNSLRSVQIKKPRKYPQKC